MLQSDIKQRFCAAVKRALKPAMRSAFWLLRMMIPITLFVVILDYLGFVQVIADFASPLFNLLGLDGRAALVCITSALTSIYSAIGVLAGLGLDFRSVPILATMCLISHNLIVETTVQKNTGASAYGIVFLRVFSSLIAGFLLNKILPDDFSGTLFLNVVASAPQGWGELLLSWLGTTGTLVIQVLVIVTLLNICQSILKEFKVIDWLTKPLRPLMAVLGLPYSTTFLWIVANMLGLAYGGAVMVGEVRKGELSEEDVSLLNTSIAQTHSLLEDSFLFISLGIGLWWVILPRMVCSVVTVWAQRGIRAYLSGHRRRKTFQMG